MQIIGHIFYKKAHYLIFCREILIIDIFSAENISIGCWLIKKTTQTLPRVYLDHGTARKYTEKRNTSQTEQQTGTDANDLCLLKYL